MTKTSATNKAELFSAEVRKEIDQWIAKYPANQKQSAVMAALRIVQDANGGWLTTELMNNVAAYLDMPPIAVYEVATFYSMYELKPVGKDQGMAPLRPVPRSVIVTIPNSYSIELADKQWGRMQYSTKFGMFPKKK